MIECDSLEMCFQCLRVFRDPINLVRFRFEPFANIDASKALSAADSVVTLNYNSPWEPSFCKCQIVNKNKNKTIEINETIFANDAISKHILDTDLEGASHHCMDDF